MQGALVLALLLRDEALPGRYVFNILIVLCLKLVEILHLHAEFGRLSRYNAQTFGALTDHFHVFVCDDIGGLVVTRLDLLAIKSARVSRKHWDDGYRALVIFAIKVGVQLALGWASLLTDRCEVLCHVLNNKNKYLNI